MTINSPYIKIMKTVCFIVLMAGYSITVKAQLTITSGATFFISGGSTVTVQNLDVVSNANITGTGILSLTGTSSSNINMNGFDLPQLEMWKTGGASATLTGSARATGGATNVGLSFNALNTGLLNLGAFNFTLNNTATTSGASNTTGFVNAVSTGQLIKEVTTNLTAFNMPVGENTGTAEYSPVSLTTTSGSGTVGVRVVDPATYEPNKPIRSTEYLSRYWPITQTGNLVMTAKGNYTDADVVFVAPGTEAQMYSHFWNGTAWVKGTIADAAGNLTGDVAVATAGDLYAMNKFSYANIRVKLNGPLKSIAPYNMTTTLGPLSEAVLPLTEPYRTITGVGQQPFSVYSGPIPSSNATEVATTLLNPGTTSADDVTDWVYVALYPSLGNIASAPIQTRSGLLQSDGDIRDINNTEFLYFKNIDDGNYRVAVHHRNHVAIVSNFDVAFSSNPSAAQYDFTTALNKALVADPSQPAMRVNGGGIYSMWAGDVNHDFIVQGNDFTNVKISQIQGAFGYIREDVQLNGVTIVGSVTLTQLVFNLGIFSSLF
ncbi:hypothetical protein BH09BAC2_BH09BAC2_22510 [soil metagenome]